MDWGERIGRRLKLRDLHVLFAVVQCGSMTKAARQLSVSNPVVSKAVANLEHTLGVRLLDRGPQGIEPTIYARALLDHGLIAFDELRQAVKHIESLTDPTAGEVKIGTSIAIAASFVPTVIARLNRRYPRISIHLSAGEASASYRALEERRVDLAILRLYAPLSRQHLHVETLYDDAYAVVAGTQSSWARQRRIELADLMNEAWALPPPDSLVGSVLVEAFLAGGFAYPRATISTYTMPARAALAATGRFLSVVPRSALKLSAGNPKITALPIDLPTTRRPTGILTFKNRTLSPATQLFIDCARTVAKVFAK
jgi:DNA-binding transcriptional LysR family regulator